MKKLKSILLIAVVGAAVLSSCSNPHSISASIEGLGNDTVIIELMPITADIEPVVDTLIASGGKFTYDVKDTLDVILYVQFPKQNVFRANGRRYESMQRIIFMAVKSGEKFKLRGSIADPSYVQYSISEPGFNQDYAAHREVYKIPALKGDSIEMVIDAETAKGKSPEQEAIVQSLFAERQSAMDKKREMTRAYIAEHPDKDLAAYYLLQEDLPSCGEYYGSLSESVKNGLFAQPLAEQHVRLEAYLKRLEAAKAIVPGAAAPEFTLKNLNGNDVSLSSLKGKYVVLDFWGSWCGWCIKGVPDMKKYHERYRNKVTFVGIACRDNDVAWREAIALNDMNWLQLFNPGGEGDVSISYAIEGYPTKIILDKELKIVEVFVGESPEFYAKLDSLK